MMIVFILVLFALFHILGSPECDDLANTTAFQLVNAINEVSAEDFPYWDYDSGIPGDENFAYYRKSPIRLCQQNYGDYQALMRFFGGEPEYKIYYEKFPEPGRSVIGWPGLWTENYPWGSGVGSTLAFWGGLKLVSVAAEAVSKINLIWAGLKRAWILRRTFSKIENARNLFDALVRPKKLLENLDFQRFIVRFTTDPDTGRSVIKFSNELTGKQFDEIVKGLDDAGLLKKSENYYLITKGGQFVADDTTRPLTTTIKLGSESKEVAVGYLKCDSCPGGIDLSQKISEGGKPGIVAFEYDAQTNTIGNALTEGITRDDYLFPQSSSREEIGKMIDEWKSSSNPLDRKRAENLEKIISLSDVGADEKLLNELTTTNYYNIFFSQKLFDGEVAKLAEGILIEGKLYKFNADKTALLFSEISDGKGGVLKGLENIWDRIKGNVKTVTDPTGVPDKLDAMGATDLLDGLKKLYDPDSVISEAGVAMFPSTFRVNAYIGAGDAIVRGMDVDDGIQYIKNLPNFADMEITDDNELRTIYNSIKNWYEDPLGGNNLPAKMPEVWSEKYFEEWSLAKETALDWADVDDGVIIGFFKQDNRPWYVKWNDKLKKYMKYPKMVWNRARVVVTPTSPIALGIFLSEYQGCLGNSMCVFSHGSLEEYPFYLKESAKDYFIRVWRPVTAWAQNAGYSALLMAVPEHPRFYVVGPCFAEAKVWKTRYQGDDTIFVSLEKFDLGDDASNYCYADTDLVNAYATAWFVSDVADVAQFVIMGTKKMTSETVQKIVKSRIVSYFDWIDPSSLLQAGMEYMISWPTEPFKPLTWKELVSGAAEIPIEETEKAIEEGTGG